MFVKWSKKLSELATKEEFQEMDEMQRRALWHAANPGMVVNWDAPIEESPKPKPKPIWVDSPKPKSSQPSQPADTEAAAPTAPKLYGLRNWSDPVELRGGRIIPASRIRECVCYLLDVRRDPWYTMNLSKGFILSKADKIDADTPDDADLYLGDNPLFGLKRIREEEYETVINVILRFPESEEERSIIKQKFGVTPKTIKWLAKKDCPKCKGTAKFDRSSYPGTMLERLEESVECECAYE